MKIGVYPGSFDPITNGHLDIIRRASRMFDRVVVGVLHNFDKKSCFSMEKKIGYINKSIHDIQNVEVRSFDGLLVDFVAQCGANWIVRGLRAISDFEYEFKMAAMNHHLAPSIEMIFLMTSQDYSYLSSSLVKEVGMLGGEIRGLIPDGIYEDVRQILLNMRK